jgi:hypothetical protein
LGSEQVVAGVVTTPCRRTYNRRAEPAVGAAGVGIGMWIAHIDRELSPGRCGATGESGVC